MSINTENVAAEAPRTATVGVPEAIVRAGRVRDYLMAEAVADAIFTVIALICRPFRGNRTNAAGG